jgi:sulfite exporter TauE/SafE/copper chaperone CopZ
MKEKIYYVKGMHCSSCEILIEKKILEIEGVEAVDASLGKGRALVNYKKNILSSDKLNNIFKKEGYTFSDIPFVDKKVEKDNFSLLAFLIAVFVFLFLIFFDRLGFSSWAVVSSNSSFLMFFVFGLIAGISSCAALVGGLILSMSKQWADIHMKKNSFFEKMKPHFLFNIGRIISYSLFGILLGFIGEKISLSFGFSSLLVLVVSVLMVFLGFQMLGIKYFQKFRITAPKFVSRYVADESNFQGKYMPFILGFLTFLLPCGFTITIQGLALISGNWFQGGLIMFLFSLGTLPSLLVISASSIALTKKFQDKFLKIAGALVLAFALFNINSQLNALGWFSFSDVKNVISIEKVLDDNNGLAPIIQGKQVIKTKVLSFKYEPDYFKLRVGIPVKWEISDAGASGCTNAIISRSLFDGRVELKKGGVVVKEFTPDKVGKHKFSCWMGMVSGIIEVVDENSNSSNSEVIGSFEETRNFKKNEDGNNFNQSCGVNKGGCGCGSSDW